MGQPKTIFLNDQWRVTEVDGIVYCEVGRGRDRQGKPVWSDADDKERLVILSACVVEQQQRLDRFEMERRIANDPELARRGGDPNDR